MGLTLGLGALLGGVASGVLGAGASIGSNVANAKAQESANKANMQIAQMNNEFNERMLQKQMDYNTQMWNKQNQYNSAASQVARLREAGLNPAIAMGNINPGIAQSAQGVNTPTASPVQVNPKQYDFSGVASSLQYALDYGLAQQMNKSSIDRISAETEAVRIDNKTRMAKAIAELKQMTENTKGMREKRTFQRIQNMFGAEMQQSQLNEINSRIDNNRQSLRNQIKTEMLMDKELQYFDQKSQQELANIAAEIALKLQQKKNLTAQEYTEYERMLDIMNTAHGKRLDNKIKAKTMEYLIQKAKYSVRDVGMWGQFNNMLHQLSDPKW